MTDTTQPTEFEDDNGTPEPQPGQAGTVLDLKAEPQEGPRALTKAAEMVPVKQHGAAPDNFAHQITLAQYMAKAQLMVPQHFHGNVGDCLAIIDISQRAGLSPYMVAAKTYKDPKGKGIAFESQLYHAFLIGSGWLKDAALHVKYDGEGDTRTCTVWGTLRNEAEPRSYTSPPLKDLLPAKNGDGVYKGSPLWGDKPDVQMFYDTSRDWSRMFAPIATLGMLAQYETIEHPLTAEIEGGGKALHERLSSADRTEGHQDGHVERELSQVAADVKAQIKPAETAQDAPGEAKTTKAKGKAAGKGKKAATADPPRTTTLAKANETVTKSEASNIADRAEAASKARKQTATQQTDAPEPQPLSLKDCKTAEDYFNYATAWIERGGDPEEALARWDAERDLRDKLTVRVTMRNTLRAAIEKKLGV